MRTEYVGTSESKKNKDSVGGRGTKFSQFKLFLVCKIKS